MSHEALIREVRRVHARRAAEREEANRLYVPETEEQMREVRRANRRARYARLEWELYRKEVF